MANEFIIKNGYRSQGNSEITGSLNVSGGITGSLSGTAAFATSASYAPDTTFPYTGSARITGSLSVTGSISILNSGGTTVLNTNTYRLIGTAGYVNIDWDAPVLYDGVAVESVNARTRILKDAVASGSVNYGGRVLADSTSTKAVDWGNRVLNRTNGNQSLDWESYGTFDTAKSQSIHWGKRWLINPSGSTILDWSSGHGVLTGTASYAVTASYVLGGGGGTPAGSQGQLQYSNGGAFGADAGLVYNTGSRSFQNGSGALAIGSYSHAQGKSTSAYAYISHTEGDNTKAGINTAYKATSVVNGLFTLSSSYGDQTTLFYAGARIAFDDTPYGATYGYTYNYAVSSSTYAGGVTSVQLVNTTINTSAADIAGIDSITSNAGDTILGGIGAHAEGTTNIAYGNYSHAEGNANTALGANSHAEGFTTTAVGEGAHAEGSSTAANGDYSHAEGNSTYTYAPYAHAEGRSAVAGYRAYTANSASSGVFELDPKYGDLTAYFGAGTFIIINDGAGEINGTPSVYKFEVASSTYNATPATEITLVNTSITTAGALVVGSYGTANATLADQYIGDASHAQGNGTQAIGLYSNASGDSTVALGWTQTVVGAYNDPISTPGAFIVGGGVDDSTRRNLLVAASGSVVISGSLLMSGSILPAVSGSVTSSFSLGSATQAWKDIWVSNGSINMLDATGSIQTSIKSTATGVALTGSLNGTVSSIVKGEATVNFGTAPGSNYTTTTISTPFVTNNSNIHIYIMSTASADHNKMEHQMFALYSTVMPDNIIDNTSFDIVALSQLRLDGTFKVRYTINNN